MAKKTKPPESDAAVVKAYKGFDLNMQCRGMHTETWSAIDGYAGVYEISDLGRVRSIVKGGILKPLIGRNGYARICLSKDGEIRRFSIHRLVLSAFVGGWPPSMEACHLNGVRADNRLANLRWDTRSANATDKSKHGTNAYNRGERHGNSRLLSGDIERAKDLVCFGYTQKELAKWLNSSQSNISRILRGRAWKHLTGPSV